MRKILLKKLGVEAEGVNIVDYKKLLSGLLQYPDKAKGGFSIDEVRMNVRILDLLDASDTELVIEEADYLALKDVVEKTKYTIASKEILQFIDDVKNAEAYKVE